MSLVYRCARCTSDSAAGLSLGASIKHTTTTEDGVNSRLDYPFFFLTRGPRQVRISII